MAERVYRRRSTTATEPSSDRVAAIGASRTSPPTMVTQGTEQSGQRVYRRRATAPTTAVTTQPTPERVFRIRPEAKAQVNAIQLQAWSDSVTTLGADATTYFDGINRGEVPSADAYSQMIRRIDTAIGGVTRHKQAYGDDAEVTGYVNEVETYLNNLRQTVEKYREGVKGVLADEMTQRVQAGTGQFMGDAVKKENRREDTPQAGLYAMPEGDRNSVITPEMALDALRGKNANAAFNDPTIISNAKAIGAAAVTGLAQFGHTLYQGADWLLPDEAVADLFGVENKVGQFFDARDRDMENVIAWKDRVSANATDGYKTLGDKVIAPTMAAVPNLLVAMMSGGATAVPQITSGSAVTASMGALAKNPNFWLSFVQSGGGAYASAKESGATELEAQATAWLTAFPSAVVEIGGGVEQIPNTKEGVLAFVKNAVEEGGEEVLQGIIEQAARTVVFEHENQWFALMDEDSVFSIPRATQEFLGGVTVGAVLNAGTKATRYAYQSYQYAKLGSQYVNGEGGVTIDDAIAIGLSNAKGTDAYNAAVKLQKKVQAGKTVSPYAVGRMVAESYTEQAQISRSIERTVLSTAEAMGIDTEAAETVSAAAVALGQKVEFVSPYDLRNRYFAGEYNAKTDTVRLNAAEIPDKLIGAILAHEMVHTAEGTKQLQALETTVVKIVGKENWSNLQESTRKAYAARGVELSDIAVKREALAGWVEKNLFTNKAFAKAVADGDANVGNALLYMVDRVRRTFVKQQENPSARNVAMLERLLMQALDNRTIGPKAGDVQGAIRYTVDNKPVVVISEDILMGVTPDQYLDVAEEIIKTRFPNGIPVSGRLVKVNKLTRDEYTHSKNTRFYKSNDGTVYADKMRAAGQLDEIVLASTNYINEDLNHARKDNFVQFARGDVLMRVGNHDYSAKVVIGFTSGNNMVLYDVVDFTPAAQPFAIKKETDTRSPSTQRNAKDSSNVSASNTTVAQNAPDVNTQSMQEGAGIFTEDGGNTAQGALLSDEAAALVRDGQWTPGRKNVEGETPSADGYTSSVTADAATPSPQGEGLGGVEDVAPYNADSEAVQIDEAAVLDTALRSQLQGRKQVDVSDLKKTNRRGQTHHDHDAAIDRLETELGKDEMLRRMYNATRMDRPKGIVEVDGRQVDAGAYMDVYERQLPDDVATLEQTVRYLEKQRAEEILRMEREGKLEGYTFGGLKLDLQLFAAKRKYDLLQLDPGESGTEVRQFYEKRLRGTDANHNDELVEMLSGRTETYNPICNEETLADAKKYLDSKKNEDSLLQRIGEYNPDDLFDAKEVAAATVLINRAINDGDLGEVADMIIGLSRKGTIAGRAVQAYSMMARMTPEGTLKAAIRTMRAEADTIICKGASEKLDVLADDIVKAIEEAEDNGLSSKEIIDRIRKGVVGKDAPVQFDHVPQDLADQVSEATGTDVTGYTIVVSTDALQAIVDGGANVETLVDTDAENLQIIVRDGTDIDTIETATVQQLTEGKKRLPAKLTREELVQLLSEDLAAEKGNFFTQEEIYDLLWKTVNEAANVPEQVKRYVLKKIRKDDGGLAQRIYELHKRGDLKQTKLRRAMEEALELPTLTDEDVKWVVEKATAIQSLEKEPVKQADAMDELYDYLGAKMHVYFSETWASWRKFAMLANPKTHIRNYLSTLAYVPIRNIDSAFATVLEWTLMKMGKLEPEQRAAAFGWRCTAHGQKIIDTIQARVPEAVLEMQRRGPKYEDGGNALRNHRKIYGKRALGNLIEKGADLNNRWMEKEDIGFFGRAYVDALGQVMTAREATKVTDEMHDIAMQRALEATFRNRNRLSQWLSKQKRGAGSNKWGERMTAQAWDVVIPFVNTPAALAEQTVLHSPAGIAVGAVDLLLKSRGKSDKSTADIINTFAKSLTGSALFYIGTLLVRAGWLRIAYRSGDKDKAADEMEGLQENALVFGDVSVPIEWLQPVAAPLIMGGAFAETNADRDDDTLDSMLGVGFSAAESLFSLSMLQSFYDVVGGYSGGFGGGVAGSFGTVAENLISQSIPTLLGQAARILDPVQRKVQDGTLKGSLLNPILAKIPWVSKNLDPELDVWGNEVYRTGYASEAAKGMNVIQQILSPANFKRGTAKNDPISDELLRLYHAYDDGGAIPTEIDRDEAAEIDAAYADVNRLLGGVNRLAVEEFINNKKAYEIYVETGELTDRRNPKKKKVTKYYRDMTDEERINVLENHIYAKAKAEIKGETAHIPEEYLNESERYFRDLLRRVQSGQRGTYGAAEPAQEPAPQQQQASTSYFDDLLRRMRNNGN